jgi:hypothetical protein
MTTDTEKTIPFNYGQLEAVDAGIDEMWPSGPSELRYLCLNLWVFKLKTNYLSAGRR